MVERLSIPSRDARVLILGTGHAMIKTALALVSGAHRGKIVALSSDGKLPSDLQPDLAACLHEFLAWQRLELKAGRILGTRFLRKGSDVRGIRVSYFSETLGTPAKLECDIVLDSETEELQ